MLKLARNKKKRRHWIRASILAVFAFLLGYALYQTVAIDRSGVVKEGERAPDFTLQSLEQGETTFSDNEGRGVLINFWASWCGPCKAEMPAIERQYEKFKEHGFEVLAVNTGESELSIRGFVRAMDLNFPILMDPDKEVTQLYNIGPLPSSVFVKPDGTINAIVVGEMNDALIEQHVIKILPES